jgi:hypothetical protein
MAETVKIYPTNQAYQYWANGNFTQLSPYTVGRAGQSGTTTYYWPLPFDLSAYNVDSITKLTLNIKMGAGSDKVWNSGDYLRASIATQNTWAAMGSAETHRTLYQPNPNEAWNAWDITTAKWALVSGAYVVMSGNKYAELYSNHSNVASSNRPYILVEYEDSTAKVRVSGSWRDTKETWVRMSGSWRQVKETWVRMSGSWRKTKT